MVVLGVVGSGLVFAAVLVWIYVKWKRTKVLPPGPRGFSLLLSHYVFGQPLHISLSKLKPKYGEIISFMYWAKPVIVLNSTHAIDQALRNRGYTFTGRNGPVIKRGLKFRQQCQTINVSESDSWKKLHSVFLKTLISCEFNVADVINDSLTSTVNVDVDLREFCNRYCLHLYTKLFFGNPSMEDYIEDLYHIFSAEHSFVWHYLHDNELYSNGMRNYRNKINKVDEFVYSALQKIRNPPTNTDSISTKNEPKNTSFLTSLAVEELSDEEIIGNVSTLLIYAVFSTAIQLHWCLLFLIHEQKENRSIEWDKEYCEAFVKEVQRLRPLLPIGYPRRVLYSTQLFGYTIPRDALILMNIHESHGDAAFWSDPDSFCPDRFMNPNENVRTAWLPYGTGRRCCIGEKLSFNIISSTLDKLACNYSISASRGKTVTLKGRSQGLLQVPKSLKVKLRQNRDVR